ncbi:MAG: OmpA family protein [Nitrospirae bacterium]|nr:OmpA family protein [Nitrospirota bacterium]
MSRSRSLFAVAVLLAFCSSLCGCAGLTSRRDSGMDTDAVIGGVAGALIGGLAGALNSSPQLAVAGGLFGALVGSYINRHNDTRTAGPATYGTASQKKTADKDPYYSTSASPSPPGSASPAQSGEASAMQAGAAAGQTGDATGGGTQFSLFPSISLSPSSYAAGVARTEMQSAATGPESESVFSSPPKAPEAMPADTGGPVVTPPRPVETSTPEITVEKDELDRGLSFGPVMEDSEYQPLSDNPEQPVQMDPEIPSIFDLVFGSDENDSEQRFEDIFFEFEKASLTRSSREALDRNIRILKKNRDMKVLIESHVGWDEETEFILGLALSERRARLVKDYIVMTGISGERLSTTSYGRALPAVTDSTEDLGKNAPGSRMNRKVHFEPELPVDQIFWQGLFR